MRIFPNRFIKGHNKTGFRACPAKGIQRKIYRRFTMDCRKSQCQSDRPLWVLVWGGLEDLAQALHDAPEIENKI